MIVKGTAARPEPFPIQDGPANKFVALADDRPVFDALRKSFFITGNRYMQARIIEISAISRWMKETSSSHNFGIRY